MLRFENVQVRKLDHLPLSETADTDAQIKYYASRLEQDPDFIEYLFRYGKAMEQAGNPEQAVESFEHGVEVDPSHNALREAYARILVKLGRYEEAIEQRQRLADSTRRNRHWHGLILAEHAMLLATVPDDDLRDGRQAEQLVRRAFKHRKKNHEMLWQALACAQAELGDFAAASDSIQKAKKEASHDDQRHEIEKIEAAIEAKKNYRIGQ